MTRPGRAATLLRVSTISRRAFLGALAAAAGSRTAAGQAAESADVACPGGKAYWETDEPSTADLEPIEAGRWRWTGPVVETAFREAVPSWEADTPAGGWIEVELRARAEGEWGGWLKLGRWHAGGAALPRARSAVSPRSRSTRSRRGRRAEALQARVTLVADESGERPTVRSLAVAFSGRWDRAGAVPSAGLASDLSSRHARRWCSRTAGESGARRPPCRW